MAGAADNMQAYTWEPQPEAQRLVDEFLDRFLDRCPRAQTLAEQMRDRAGTRFKDWVDSVFVPSSEDGIEGRLELVGFEHDAFCELCPGLRACYRHRGGLFPAIVLTDEASLNVAVKAESVADFLFAQRVPAGDNVGGEPLSRTRWAMAFEGDGAQLWAIERHGYAQFGPADDTPERRVRALTHLERFRTRRREFGLGPEADEAGFAEANRLVDDAIADLGRDWACDLWFRAERDYWQSRNRAARVQFNRQNALGLGWANHDHHTFRCSRRNFPRVIALLEKLGFHCRERFYAGGEAGWGAQVLEHAVTGIVIFADVDMTPTEVRGDFAHEGFGEKDDLGTVGLWVELHGESVLQAGMHHLECQFDWHALKAQLEAEAGIGMMDPFTTFPFLRQAFTEGEPWRVVPERIDALLESGRITPGEAERFRTEGARGSHLENLERNDGFKGFNQQGVSDIIARTDARR